MVSSLELAYAVTIHKAQGSQFGITFVGHPRPVPAAHTRAALHGAHPPPGTSRRPQARRPREPSRVRLARRARKPRGRLTCLFRDVDPFTAPTRRVLDGAHMHRTGRNEPVRSKSEVIVANVLAGLNVSYAYEEQLRMTDGTSRLPGLHDPRGRASAHLLGAPRHARPPRLPRRLGSQEVWYQEHGILPWLDGGGSDGTLVWSSEEQGMSTPAIKELAREVLGLD